MKVCRRCLRVTRPGALFCGHCGLQLVPWVAGRGRPEPWWRLLAMGALFFLLPTVALLLLSQVLMGHFLPLAP